MTTTIAPTSGAGALFTQQGTGTTPGYSALDDRRSNSGALQEGVLNASDFMVVQRGAGANLSVDIGMPAGGFAYVQGDTINGQALYCVPVHSATINEVVTTADITNPRIDQVILEVLDNVLDASGNNLARTRIVAGTATGGATLANRTGAAALPGSALLLADLLVTAGGTSVSNTQIRDRRKWARGAYLRIARTAGNYTTTATTLTEIDTTNLKPRLEFSGVPVAITMEALTNHSVANTSVVLGLFLDGAAIDSTAVLGVGVNPTAGNTIGNLLRYVAAPTAGSHTVSPTYAGGAAGTSTIVAIAAQPLIFTVEEVLRANTANNSVTTG
jgi:hypothetical protein